MKSRNSIFYVSLIYVCKCFDLDGVTCILAGTIVSVGILFSFAGLNIDTLCQYCAVTLLHVVPCNVIIADNVY